MTPPAVSGPASMVGREAELAALSAGLDAALAGRGSVVSLVGEPGIGKTRLAAALATRARDRGARVQWGRCSEDAGAPAFWPWIQILRGCIRDQEPDALLAQLGPGAADIAEVVGQVREYFPHLPAPSPLAPEQARFRFFDSVTAFLTNVAQARPLVLILDDLQWADTSSLLLLDFLGREIGAGHLLIVGTYRDVDVDRAHPLARTLAALSRAQVHQRVVLHGLGEHDVGRCIAAVTGGEVTAEVIAAVHHDTAGNPFFVIETARVLAREAQGGGAPSPEFVAGRGDSHARRDLIEYRLGDLPAECHRILTLAAVIGREFGVPELTLVAELEGDSLLELLERAEVARVIVAVPGAVGRYRFAHALIREALYDDVPTTRRIRLHRHVAEALEACYGSAPHAYLGLLAYHFVQAAPGGDTGRAVGYARRAGDSARAQLAYEDASHYYAMALQALDLHPEADEGERCALLLALGEAQNWSGEADAARQTFQTAAALAGRLADADGVARAALGYGAVTATGVVDTVRVALLEQARAALGERDSRLRVQVLAALSGALYWSDRPEQSIQLSEEALSVATRLSDPGARAHALIAQREALWRPEYLHERLEVSTALCEAAAAAGDAELMLWSRRWLIADALEQGDIAAVDQAIAAHAGLAERVRQPSHLWYAARWRAMRTLLEGRLGEAEDLIQRANALGRRTQRHDASALFLVQWAALRRLQGRAAEIEPALREVAGRYTDTPVWRAGLAAVYAELGRVDDARGEFERLARNGFAALPRDANWLVAVTSLAQVCAFLADKERAAVLYDLLLPYRAHLVVAGAAVACQGAVSHYLGLLAAVLARWDAARTQFEDALARQTEMGARPLIATTQLAYAAMLHACGGPGDHARALELVSRALASARDLGLAHLAARAEALRTSGVATASAPGFGGRYTAGLTVREREVAGLLVHGLTNREIAAALVISERTADTHVANILGKLGFHTRAQVAAWAAERGLHTPTGA